MSKIEKLIIKITAIPPPADFKWSDLQTLLEHFGYKQQNGNGSRRKFYNPSKDALIVCHEPHPDPNLDKGCIKDVVTHLKENQFIQT